MEGLGGDGRRRWRSDPGRARLRRRSDRERPRDFLANGWVGGALQGAWSAVARATSLQDALERAVCGGNDTDTVAVIAGGLAGAVFGAAAVPDVWRRVVHGWPGLTADDLAGLALQAVRH